MNQNKLIERILHQWTAKVICLIIAIFLYVFNQVSLIDKKIFTIPLKIQENGSVMHVGTVQNSVSIIVRTSSENMKLISLNEISATVNLDTIVESGKYELPVNLVISNNLKSLDPMEIKLKDNNVSIEVDKKAFKYVNIEPSIFGNVAHGYEIEKVEVNPSSVMIIGPETILNSIDNIYTDSVNVSNAEVSFTTKTKIKNINQLIRIEEESEYKASVTVVPQNMEKEFVVPVELMNLPSDLVCSEPLPTVTIKLLGTVNYLENYSVPNRSVQAYLSDITEIGTYELPLYFYFPSVLEIVEKSSDKITVTLIKKNIDNNTELEKE